MQNIAAQSLYVKRTDVDESRFGFVTASYTFGMDIHLKDLKNSNGIAFQLNFNQGEVVKFSQWLPGDFGKPQIIPMLNPDGTSKLIIAVGLGNSTIPDSIKEPKVLHLEFVVLQNAANASIVNFAFQQPVATIIENGNREIVALEAERIDYTIHGFVNVWPGDTDNNGIVNHLDYANVTKYIGLGSATKNMKSFKRKSGSAIWAPHRVLTWDNAEVTYSDCDGNGDITITDMLIVSYNMGKDTLTSKVNKTTEEIQEDFPKPVYFESPEYIKIPLTINPELEFITAAGTFDISNIITEFEFIGVEPGNTFSEKPFVYFTLDESNKLHLASGSYLREQSKFNQSNLSYIVFKPRNTNNRIKPNVITTSLKAITTDGYIFNLSPVSDVNEREKMLHAYYSNGVLAIQSDRIINSVKIIDLLGLEIYSQQPNLNIANTNLTALSSGIYFIMVQLSDGAIELRKLSVTN